MKRNAVLVLKPHFGKVEHRTQQGRAAFLPEQLRAHVDLHAYIESNRAVTAHPGTIGHRRRVRVIQRVPFTEINAWQSVRKYAAHHHQCFEQRRDFLVRGKEQRDVREWADGQEHDLSRMGTNGLAQKLHGLTTRKRSIVVPFMQRAGLRRIWLPLRSQQRVLNTGKDGDVFPGHFTERTGKHRPLLSFADVGIQQELYGHVESSSGDIEIFYHLSGFLNVSFLMVEGSEVFTSQRTSEAWTWAYLLVSSRAVLMPYPFRCVIICTPSKEPIHDHQLAIHRPETLELLQHPAR